MSSLRVADNVALPNNRSDNVILMFGHIKAILFMRIVQARVYKGAFKKIMVYILSSSAIRIDIFIYALFYRQVIFPNT